MAVGVLALGQVERLGTRCRKVGGTKHPSSTGERGESCRSGRGAAEGQPGATGKSSASGVPPAFGSWPRCSVCLWERDSSCLSLCIPANSCKPQGFCWVSPCSEFRRRCSCGRPLSVASLSLLFISSRGVVAVVSPTGPGWEDWTQTPAFPLPAAWPGGVTAPLCLSFPTYKTGPVMVQGQHEAGCQHTAVY